MICSPFHTMVSQTCRYCHRPPFQIKEARGQVSVLSQSLESLLEQQKEETAHLMSLK